MGLLNTAVDVAIFSLLHATLGLVLANLVSTSAGMLCSFVLNGRLTFGRDRLTLRHALLFLATTGATLWLLSPVVIAVGVGAGLAALPAKLVAVTSCLVVNFLAYRHVVWPAPPLVEEVAQQASPLVEEVAQQTPPLVEEVAQQDPPLVEEVAQQPSRDPVT